MRRVLSFSLVMLFGWMLIAPLLAPDAEANLPACCRRNGKHHCTMRMTMQRDGGRKGFTTVSEKCPCCPSSACAAHSATYKPESGRQFLAEGVRHPGVAAQTEALYRVSSLRSHQKRGPPTPLA